MNITKELLYKYNTQGPRYTSYPPATFFNESYNGDVYISQLELSNTLTPKNISLYFHIPFCQKLCHFCGCHSIAKPSQESLVDAYVNAMLLEIENTAKHLSKDRAVSQIHWGGGTPHSIPDWQIGKIMTTVYNNFTIASDAEIAMECNPAYTDLSFFDFLKSLGFTRISLGIQDFDQAVLKIVNRDASKHPVEHIVNHLHNLGMGVNFDLIYGLPGQAVESFFASIDETLRIKPDRIATFSYAHVPWVKKAQAYLEKFTIPEPEEKFVMLLKAYDIFSSNGYIPIGMDHFAQKSDELSKAQTQHDLHRNFQGYTTKKNTGQVYAFGVSGISQLTNSYAQNTKITDEYIRKIHETGTAIERGYILSDEDKIVREVISEIMCNKFIDFKVLAQNLSTPLKTIKKVIGFEAINFDEFIADELLKIDDDKLFVSELGSFFIRNIAMLFDPKLGQKQGMYSKTV